LTSEGILIVNGTSPFFTLFAYGKIRENLKEVFPWIKPYWISLSQQGEWAYFMASFKEHNLANLDYLSRWHPESLTTAYAKTLSLFPKDLLCKEAKFSVPLQKLYKDGWAYFINKNILEKSYVKD
jgi:predicted membrane-bound spermidine synthase